MGKVTRWLRGLFSGGGGKMNKWVFNKSSNNGKEEVGGGDGTGLGGGFDGKGGVGDGDDQNKRAIAVAAATAAVAEVAVAAAQAAAAVVRLTSNGRVCGVVAESGMSEEWAAVRIQSSFRGYLARRALKALKGLVKLQALVRGHIIRKQTAEALRCMQALVRVQSRARACRVLTDNINPRPGVGSATHHHGRSTRGTYEHVSGTHDSMPEPSKTLTKKPSRSANGCSIDHNVSQHPSLNWLDNWMEERYLDSHETVSRPGTSTPDDEKNTKILEIDPGKPQIISRRCHRHHSMSSDLNSRSFTTMLESPSKDSTIAQGSSVSPSSVDNQQSLNPLMFPPETTELYESPLFLSARSRRGSARGGSFTPSNSDCSRSLFSGYSGYPNYMAYTQSSRAKARSQSAPKQRPEFEKSCSMGRISSGQVSGAVACHSSSSSHGSSSIRLKLNGKAYPGSGRLDRMGMPV